MNNVNLSCLPSFRADASAVHASAVSRAWAVGVGAGREERILDLVAIWAGHGD